MFGAPAYLWLLFLIVPLILFQRWRQRRRRLVVATTLLWPSDIARVTPAMSWRRWHVTIPFLLQLLAFTFFVFAAARWHPPASRRSVALVLDASLSMRLQLPEGVTRLHAARQAAIRALRSCPEGDRVLLLVTSEWPHAVACQEEPTRAADRLRAWDERAAGVAPELSIEFAVEWLKRSSHPARRLIYVGDGALHRWPEEQTLSAAQIRFDARMAGTDAANVAVVSLEAERDRNRPDRVGIYFGVGATPATEAIHTKWEASLDGKLIAEEDVTIRPGGIVPVRLHLQDGGRGGTLRIRIPANDACAEDNASSLSITPHSALRVALHCRAGNTDLRAAVRSTPGVELIETSTYPHPVSPADVWVTEGTPQPEVRAEGVPYLWFAVDTPTPGTAQHEPQTLDCWSHDHPVVRGVDLASIRFQSPESRARGEKLPALASTGDTPWIAVREHGGPRGILVGFDLLSSDFTERPDFPVFVANAIHWLARGTPAAPTLSSQIEALDPARPCTKPPASWQPALAAPAGFRQPPWVACLLTGLVCWSAAVLLTRRERTL